MLGFTENLSGAWQIVRKTGRIHVKQGFLEQNQNQLEKNYFEVVMNIFIERFIPFLTGEQVCLGIIHSTYSKFNGILWKNTKPSIAVLELPAPDGNEKKKVRFAQSYAPSQIADVWKRFFNLISAQMTDSFELERTKQRNAQSQKTLAPHQHIEQSERKKKRIQVVHCSLDTCTQ
ncbi:hypothetical protein ANCCAN_14908 [Ancylostoma caninum]|uniref:Uncharacterized protein n=1 Tax=Ancylostoma caninum TaxID=29170 RepID=A0A368G408_ANCCA|nr:hypothetical protein ANCCAN_14908 [Ancylostoma caninum]